MAEISNDPRFTLCRKQYTIDYSRRRDKQWCVKINPSDLHPLSYMLKHPSGRVRYFTTSSQALAAAEAWFRQVDLTLEIVAELIADEKAIEDFNRQVWGSSS